MGTLPNGTVAGTPPRHQPLFLLGVLLVFLGIGGVFLQMWLRHLSVPWFMPIAGTAGVLLMAAGAWQRGGVLRWIGLVVFAALVGSEWYMIAVLGRAPAYTGPFQPGQHVPAFAATFADAQPFTDKNLEDGKPSMLVFFRGRW